MSFEVGKQYRAKDCNVNVNWFRGAIVRVDFIGEYNHMQCLVISAKNGPDHIGNNVFVTEDQLEPCEILYSEELSKNIKHSEKSLYDLMLEDSRKKTLAEDAARPKDCGLTWL